MARIRSLKPEFWDDRKLARATSRDARMLYMGLWNQADEHGRLNGDVVWLKGRIFPYDDDIDTAELGTLLDQLERAGRIHQYEVDGDPFIYLPKLAKHQRLEPAKVESRIPEPPPRAVQVALNPNPGAHESEPDLDESARDADVSALLYGSGSMEQGSGVVARKPPRATSKRGTRLPEDWKPSDNDQAWTLERLSQADAAVELEKFRNHWRAKPGKDATKLDWDATWRNWVLNANGRASPRRSPQQETDDHFDRAARRMGVAQ